MLFKLFIDDLRQVNDVFPDAKQNEFIVVRSYNEAMQMINYCGCPDFISFDDDLGPNQKEGYDIAKKIVEMIMDGELQLTSDFSFNVHSANPVAVVNIKTYLDNFLECVKNEEL